MFTFICKNALARKEFLKIESTATWSFLSIKSLCSESTDEGRSFRVSYLINSCGLSEEKATSIAKRIHFETPTNPDSVLTLFRQHQFPNTQITKIIQKIPSLLLSSVDKTLKPKLDFFKSKGLSGPQLARALLGNPMVLTASLDERIIPSFDFLKNIVQTETNVIQMLKRWIDILRNDFEKQLTPNVALLQASGVSSSTIQSVLVRQPRALLQSPSHFNEIVEEVMEMGFDPSEYRFVLAIFALTSMTKSTLEAKFNVYRKWGWSDGEIQGAFRKQPYCVMISEKKINGIMDYLANTIGYDPQLLARSPGILLFSLEKRIIPRFSVVQVLIRKGLVKKKISLSTFLKLKENDFEQNFIAKFENEVPGLLKVYQGTKR